MSKRTKILLIGGLLVLCQIFYFSDYIFPFHWGQIKISGLACTCPDESVINGQWYLKHITPDSLKKFNLDYSEIYVTEKPSTDYDPMGVDLYMIKGKVIGKDRVSEYDPWNPVVKVEKWREVDILIDWVVKAFLIIQLLILIILLRNKRIKTT